MDLSALAAIARRHGGPGDATLVDDDVWMIDLKFQGYRGVIAAYLIRDGDEAALIETGPTATLPALLAGIEAAGVDLSRVRKLLVTHIHLDHSGAAGVLMRALPHARVFVHPVGAPHLIDPTRLVASATRLYTDRMDTLWGEVAPVAAARVVELKDGDRVAIGGRTLVALDTPGHATHHLCYWEAARAALFTGDVGGVRMAGTTYACPPPPPPELDPEAWARSVERMRALSPRRLYLTHGGPIDDVEFHLDQLMPNLTELRELALAALRAGADQMRLTALIHDHVAAKLVGAPLDALEKIEWATPSYLAAPGLTRLLLKRGEVAAPPVS
jgi:glyoxylase-like metal-dependent hydrolase (beta-lactamase superfamily II)